MRRENCRMMSFEIFWALFLFVPGQLLVGSSPSVPPDPDDPIFTINYLIKLKRTVLHRRKYLFNGNHPNRTIFMFLQLNSITIYNSKIQFPNQNLLTLEQLLCKLTFDPCSIKYIWLYHIIRKHNFAFENNYVEGVIKM